MDMCCCEVCYLNACAIALNSLKQLYVTTYKGALLSKISTIGVGYQAVLICEIIKALMIVKASPDIKPGYRIPDHFYFAL